MNKQTKILLLLLQLQQRINGSLIEWQRNIVRGTPLDSIGVEVIAGIVEDLGHSCLEVAKAIRSNE